MTRSQQETLWPFLCILACLFVLSVAAPRALDHAARTRTAAAPSQVDAPPLAAQQESRGGEGELVISPMALPSEAANVTPIITPIAIYAAPTAKVAGNASTAQELSDPSIDDLAQDEYSSPSPAALLPQTEAGSHDTAKAESKPGWHSQPKTTAVAEPQPTATQPTKPAIEVAIITPSPRSDYAPLPATSLPLDENVVQPATPIANKPALAEPVAHAPTPVAIQLTAPSQPSLRPQLTADVPHVASIERLPRLDHVIKVSPPRVVKSCWKTPESLRLRLEKLLEDEATAGWATQVEQRLGQLESAVLQGPAAVHAVFAELQNLVGRVEPLAERLATPRLATDLRRTGHALSRRVELWNQAVTTAGLELTPALFSRNDPQQLNICLANLDILHDDSPEAQAWQRFLVLDALAKATSNRETNEQEVRKLARLALARLATPMTAEQREVVATGPMVSFADQLRHVAAEPVDLAETLDTVEHFEQSGLPSYARLAADDCRRLSFSPSPAEREVGDRLEVLYRNANVRIAFTAALLNRMLPAPKLENEPVRDTILGLPVQGRSTYSSNLSVRFIPDPQRLLMSFEVHGTVTADTSSSAGPATFFHDSHARYAAHKPLEIEAEGIRLDDTDVSVVNHMRLRALRTKFDSIPVFGSLAREAARSQQEEQQAAANRETEEKVSARCRQRIDAESYAKLDLAVSQMREHLFAPLSDLSLMPTLIGGLTTEDRMAMRLRLAASHQLGSDTPRPRAPSDSLASVQVHETALNNLIEQLDLNGRRMSLPELVQYVSSKLHRTAPVAIDPAHADLTITFAAKDALYVRCTEDQLAINLAIAELSVGSRSWQNFRVRVAYRPEVHGRSAELVRDGVVQLIGRLSTGSQIALRGVFSKAFPKDGSYHLSPQWLLDDPRVKDLAVTQFVIDDGWISVALGPNRAAQTTLAEKKAHKPERKTLAWRKQLLK